jgi:hypothetical protein
MKALKLARDERNPSYLEADNGDNETPVRNNDSSSGKAWMAIAKD